jgi:protein-S-isoprenylcysteine O-methyltransferase Ste14
VQRSLFLLGGFSFGCCRERGQRRFIRHTSRTGRIWPKACNMTETDPKGGPLRVLLRPPIVFLCAILMGIALNRAWSLPFLPSTLGWLGRLVTLCAVLLLLLSFREFRAAGTSVRGSKRTTTIVRTGPYRFSRNPIYVSFILLVLGLSVWLNDLWLLVTLVPAVGFIAAVVIPREERFLERNFHDQYSSYKATVRRWL